VRTAPGSFPAAADRRDQWWARVRTSGPALALAPAFCLVEPLARRSKTPAP